VLVIRKAQLDAFLKSQEDSFIRRMAEHLKKKFEKEISKHGIQTNDLNIIARKGLNSANKYNIIYEDDVTLYIECIAILGPDFDINMKYPEVSEILNKKDLDGTEKMDLISEFLTFELDQSS
jgi:hypothetical protein